jgi:hypothetical protein
MLTSPVLLYDNFHFAIIKGLELVNHAEKEKDERKISRSNW